MNITSYLFEAYLKCPTKCFLRSRGEVGSGNAYADWVRSQTDSYRNDRIKELKTIAARDGRIIPGPLTETPRIVESGYTFDFVARAQGLESHIHIVERTPPEAPGKPVQFIPIRFIYTNKINKDDKLLLAFDALVLSEVFGCEIRLGKINHGDDHATLKVKIAALGRDVQKHVEKIDTLLSSHSPPNLVLNRHCAECEFQARCRQKAIETDDLSLLSRNDGQRTEQTSQQGHLHGEPIFLHLQAEKNPQTGQEPRQAALPRAAGSLDPRKQSSHPWQSAVSRCKVQSLSRHRGTARQSFLLPHRCIGRLGGSRDLPRILGGPRVTRTDHFHTVCRNSLPIG